MEKFKLDSLLRRLAKSLLYLKIVDGGETGYAPVYATSIELNLLSYCWLFIKGGNFVATESLLSDDSFKEGVAVIFPERHKIQIIKQYNTYHIGIVQNFHFIGIKINVKMFHDIETIKILNLMG